MPRVRTDRPPTRALILLFPVLMLGPGAAQAYAPHAAAAIANRIPDALPPAARWDPSWSAAAAAEVERLLAEEDADPERYASRHRFIVGPLRANPAADDAAAGTAQVIGHAPYVLATAAADLTRAFGGGDASLIVRRVAELAICAADLADPFLATSPESGALPELHARFSDLFDPEFNVSATRVWTVASGVHAAGIVLAEESARRRPPVEDALRRGDADAWAAIRNERLGAALSLARTLALGAWMQAVSPSLEHAAPEPGRARVFPNPVRASTTVSFSLPAPLEARIEIFDLGGRRVWARELGACRAGPQQVALAADAIRPLGPGLYLARISAGHYTAVGRLMRLAD